MLYTERLTPHLVRVVLGGPGLRGFTAGEYSDNYVKLLFGRPGVRYPEPFDMEAVRRDLPREDWPRQRTYTVRAWDPDAAELTIDFVVHGDEGLGGPWAAAARPGDEIHLLGPGGGYLPSASADWHLLAGDESALPAIAASLERLPADATAHVLLEVADEREELKLPTPAGTELTWLHRGTRPVGEALVEAVRALDFPAGRPHVFVHGEAGFVRRIRRLLRVERGVPLEDMSISGYWRLGADDESWRAVKVDWNRQTEREEAEAVRSRQAPTAAA
ncbi:NADPH-dependent ferric siderophore reductase [Allostreptomyces psammosilenae]|uniref:NADPH-dependent ferric siderophore reductase n=1 Tax=Allostreptomyces psammosilenae TaxID=1892865 RepID=A0A852ZRI1_9ACTN|nr:NADPH-dependent ferric siderophore reductase [Allostreptomyces psammosilenae]